MEDRVSPRGFTGFTSNASLDVIRLRKPQAEVPEVKDASPTPERLAVAGQIREKLQSAMEELSPQERAAFVMRHFENRPISEIAESLSLRENATKHSIFRAVRKLRMAMGGVA
ncbi:MAG: sigma-70 family RNA polymerase sigma factor [Verrucomicrobiota bacterium]